MNENTLAENEEKVLLLILLLEGSASEKEVKKVLECNDEVLREARSSLLLKELIHDLTPEFQFGKNGRTEALKILTKRLFPRDARARKTVT
jgi:hypothetical protein